MPRKDTFFFGLLILSGLYGFLTIASFFSGDLQKRFEHDMPFWQWSVLQQCPAMYNLQNTVEVYYGDGSKDIRHYNHHPMRLLYENKFAFKDQVIEEIRVYSIRAEDTLYSRFSFIRDGREIRINRLGR